VTDYERGAEAMRAAILRRCIHEAWDIRNAAANNTFSTGVPSRVLAHAADEIDKLAGKIRDMAIPDAPSPWRPMDEAPRDGTLVLVAKRTPVGDKVEVAHYDPETKLWAGVMYLTGPLAPFAWMPLPATPESEPAPAPSVPTLAELDALAEAFAMTVGTAQHDAANDAHAAACERAGICRYEHYMEWFKNRRGIVHSTTPPGPRHATPLQEAMEEAGRNPQPLTFARLERASADARALRVGRAVLASAPESYDLATTLREAAHELDAVQFPIAAKSLRAIAAALDAEVQP
jgi:hypothetical protein